MFAPFLEVARKIIAMGASGENMQKTSDTSRNDLSTEEDGFVTPELSIFRTRLPRPTSTMRHLVLAAATFILALIAAIFYAER